MPIIPLDVTIAGLIPEGQHTATVAKLDYQIKTGDKWNKDGTSTTTFDEWSKFDAQRKRLHYVISVPGRGNIFHDLYVMESAAGFVQSFLKACGVPYSKEGFDAEACIGRQVGINMGIKEDPNYGPQNTFTFYKV